MVEKLHLTHAENTPNKSKAPTGTGLSQTGTYSAFDVSGAIFCEKTYILHILHYVKFHFGFVS